MTPIKPFDPIAVRETMDRIRKRSDQVRIAERAAQALLWFNEYAWGDEALKVIDVRMVSVIASATPNAEKAQEFVKAAARELAPKIVARAIALAMADLEKHGAAEP